SRGPGSSSRKKSASWASKERSPFGTILKGCASEYGVMAVVEEVTDGPFVAGTALCGMSLGAGREAALFPAKKCHRSSAKFLAVVYRSDARFETALRQMRSSSLGMASST